jgi:hypothetical protein
MSSDLQPHKQCLTHVPFVSRHGKHYALKWIFLRTNYYEVEIGHKRINARHNIVCVD